MLGRQTPSPHRNTAFYFGEKSMTLSCGYLKKIVIKNHPLSHVAACIQGNSALACIWLEFLLSLPLRTICNPLHETRCWEPSQPQAWAQTLPPKIQRATRNMHSIQNLCRETGQRDLEGKKKTNKKPWVGSSAAFWRASWSTWQAGKRMQSLCTEPQGVLSCPFIWFLLQAPAAACGSCWTAPCTAPRCPPGCRCCRAWCQRQTGRQECGSPWSSAWTPSAGSSSHWLSRRGSTPPANTNRSPEAHSRGKNHAGDSTNSSLPPYSEFWDIFSQGFEVRDQLLSAVVAEGYTPISFPLRREHFANPSRMDKHKRTGYTRNTQTIPSKGKKRKGKIHPASSLLLLNPQWWKSWDVGSHVALTSPHPKANFLPTSC